MFKEIRRSYPGSGLISELLEIKHGKYIVRTSVIIDGITVATGLGGAETVESAEDRARERALSLLENEIETPITTKKIEPEIKLERVEEEIAEPIVIPSPEVKLERVEEEIAEPIVIPSPVTKTSKRGKIKDSNGNGAIKNRKEEVKNLETFLAPPESPEIETIVEEPVNIEVEPPSDDEPEPVNTIDSFPIENEVSSVSEDNPLDEYFETEEQYLTPTEEETPEPPEEKNEEPPEEIDYSVLKTKIEMEMARLGWTMEQGRDYLISTYGKRSRLLLTNEELLEFYNYLASVEA